ncbi:MAG: ATP-binding protein [Candidatus Micrarchaeota archaeon]
MDFETIAFQNPHWYGKHDVPPEKRRFFYEFIKGLDNRMIYTIRGLRRVGKSTLLKQLINYIIKERKIDPSAILYFSFDESKAEPKEVITAWASRLGMNIRTAKLFVFFDEIQKVDDWGNKIKLLYDNSAIKFFLSGSSALMLKKGKESLAGRELEFELRPFTFNEWLEFKKINPALSSWKLYEQYLFRQLPELAVNLELDHVPYTRAIVNKVVDSDIPDLFGLGHADRLREICFSLYKQPGQIIDYNDIAKDFSINRETASKYMDAAVSSYLLRKLYNYSKNARKSEKSAKKFYPYSSTLVSAIFPYPVDLSLIVETDVGFQLGAEYFWNSKGREIDFIVGSNFDCGVEVKFRNNITNSDIRTLNNNPLKLNKRIVVVKPSSKFEVSAKCVYPYNLVDYAVY